MDPSTYEQWVEVAKERSQDARILSDSNRYLGAVYMAGYSIECYLKAYLRKNKGTRSQGDRLGACCFLAEPGEIGLTALEGSGDGID